MGTVDYFYISLTIGVLVLAGCVLMISIKIKDILENVRMLTEDAASVSSDILSIKDGLKTTIISLVQNLLEKAKKGGEKKS